MTIFLSFFSSFLKKIPGLLKTIWMVVFVRGFLAKTLLGLFPVPELRKVGTRVTTRREAAKKTEKDGM